MQRRNFMGAAAAAIMGAVAVPFVAKKAAGNVELVPGENLGLEAMELAKVSVQKHNKDQDWGWHKAGDIRKVLSDNAIKDMMTDEDREFLAKVHKMLGQRANSTAAPVIWGGIGMGEPIRGLKADCVIMDETQDLPDYDTLADISKWGVDKMPEGMLNSMVGETYTFADISHLGHFTIRSDSALTIPGDSSLT